MNRRVAVLVSGGGRSLENLAELCAAGDLDAELGLVISNRPSAFALERAQRLELPSLVIDAEREMTPEAFSESVFQAAADSNCSLVVLAGFLRYLPIPPEWEGKVLNIHPSLLPAFGGKGYYGDKVHAAVLKRGVKYTGCTVHYVDNVYDNGPILVQRVLEVSPEDDVHSLGSRVFEEEKVALPAAIALHFAQEE
jgi:phosphoribosylglycinamide formyltransferase-1